MPLCLCNLTQFGAWTASWGFAQLEKHPNAAAHGQKASPACLQLVKQPRVKAETQGQMESPPGEVDFANVEGQMVDDDSGLIMVDALCNSSFDVKKVDSHLAKKRLTAGHMTLQSWLGSFVLRGAASSF